MKRAIIFLLVVGLLVSSGCVKVGPITPEGVPPEVPSAVDSNILLQELEDKITKFEELKKKEIDCSIESNYNILFATLELKNNENFPAGTWYPSVSEGRLTSIRVEDFKNSGCTKINPSFNT